MIQCFDTVGNSLKVHNQFYIMVCILMSIICTYTNTCTFATIFIKSIGIIQWSQKKKY